MKIEKNKKRKKLFIFIGPPGSGKGTLSELCLKKCNWIQLSTGNLCRRHINQKTEIGKLIDFTIKSGKLISDRVIISMVEEWLIEQSENNNSIILDGFPRTIGQAKALAELLQKERFSNFKVKLIKMNVKDEQIIARLSARRICNNSKCQAVYSLIENSSLKPKKSNFCDKCSEKLIQRSDDNKESIKERLKIYYQHEKELINFYKDISYSVIDLNVDQLIEKVFEDFLNLVEYNDNY